MKATVFFLIAALGGLLIYCSFDFPHWGDPAAPASGHVSPYYIEQAESQTHTPNIVTAVLADYRSYDTMFETVVIFAAGVSCLFLLRSFRTREPETRLYRHIPTGITLRIGKGGKIPSDTGDFQRIDSTWVPYALIVKTTCRLIIPFIQIFALYVVAHGHYSPGGGFQGGVIFGASLILFAVAYDLRSGLRRLSERTMVSLCALGVFFYAAVGAGGLFFGGNYLDYGAPAAFLGMAPAGLRSLGILLVEIGVGISVMAVMAVLYYILSSAGSQEEGL